MRIGVIMAGGAGERFWPYSRRHNPKQLLSLASDQPMLVESIKRINPVIPTEHIFIVAGDHLRHSIKDMLPKLPEENLLIEPMPRNTAPCLALAVAAIHQRYGDATMAVLTADHVIRNNDAYLRNVTAAMEFAEKNPALLTLGIPPRHPETGYGYIEAGSEVSRTKNGTIRKVVRFHEKPERKTAELYVKSADFFWNSGMFFWNTGTLMREIQKCSPEFGTAIIQLGEALTSHVSADRLKRIFESLPKTSIDFALMEKSDSVYVVEAEFEWHDIGTWDSLDRILRQADQKDSLCIGTCLTEDNTNTMIFNKPIYRESGREQIIVTLGLENMVVINTGDVVFVCPKDRCQDIKEIVRLLEKHGMSEYIE